MKQQASGGFPFLSILALIFITLKLTGYIGWSWVWVLAPLWIPFAIVLAVLIVVGIVALVVGVRRERRANRRRY